MRLVDADTLRKDIEKDRDASDMPKMWYQGIEYAINHIIHAPTVDAEPVKHGHWEEDSSCSVCGKKAIKRVIFGGETIWEDEYDYCPHCGAKMDEVEDGV